MAMHGRAGLAENGEGMPISTRGGEESSGVGGHGQLRIGNGQDDRIHFGFKSVRERACPV